ncbi:hypothetical protein E2L06_01310 [Haloterrigena sp. H1]|uniref:DUF7504 family protein n=1 Tax=Haloterrigena sp. H1 TaxID=2552943 RepID=UPI00110E1B4F|nr:hypothetical protein [Haloterrigena sp. H1]TMT85311.1 hypothetical protein E2L06_01310 [Haloterrigena sp. H1]
MNPTSPAAIESPATVLLVHPRQTVPDACEELCGDDETAHLAVTFADAEPTCSTAAINGQFGQLTVGNVLTDATDESTPDFTQSVVTDSILDPTDLTAIGIAVSRFCEHWGDTDEKLTVCFDSLDALLRHTPPTDVFQFTHVLANRLASVDADAHFHFDPTRHEDRVVSTFGAIFDAVVATDDDESLPEATDEDIATTQAEWEDTPLITTDPDAISEATDEDIQRVLDD